MMLQLKMNKILTSLAFSFRPFLLLILCSFAQRAYLMPFHRCSFNHPWRPPVNSSLSNNMICATCQIGGFQCFCLGAAHEEVFVTTQLFASVGGLNILIWKISLY